MNYRVRIIDAKVSFGLNEDARTDSPHPCSPVFVAHFWIIDAVVINVRRLRFEAHMMFFSSVFIYLHILFGTTSGPNPDTCAGWLKTAAPVFTQVLNSFRHKNLKVLRGVPAIMCLVDRDVGQSSKATPVAWTIKKSFSLTRMTNGAILFQTGQIWHFF